MHTTATGRIAGILSMFFMSTLMISMVATGALAQSAQQQCREAAWRYVCPEAADDDARQACFGALQTAIALPDECQSEVRGNAPIPGCRQSASEIVLRLQAMADFACIRGALEVCPRKATLPCPASVLEQFEEPVVLWVVDVRVGVPMWMDETGGGIRTGFSVEFNRAVDGDTLVVGRTVRLDIVNDTRDRNALDVVGSLVSNGALSYGFVTATDPAELVDARPGDSVIYTIHLTGNDVGAGAVRSRDLDEEPVTALDGDGDGLPGGNFVRQFLIIHE